MSRYGRIRRRTHEILEPGAPGDTASRVFDIALVTLIALNVAAVVVETVEPWVAGREAWFHAFEVVSVGIFSVEYVLRVWAAKSDPRFADRWGRLRFAMTPFALVDLLAVVPAYLVFLAVDFRFLRAVRLTRIFRIVKLGRYSRSLRTFGRVLRARASDLVVVTFTISILLLVSSALMYYAEHEAQPEVFSSIPAAMWWGVVTLTTVGYGDVYPVTAVGKLLGAVVSLLGIGLFALPAGLLGAGFVEELERVRSGSDGDLEAGPDRCPTCGARRGRSGRALGRRV